MCDSLASKAGDFGAKTGIDETIANCKLDVVADKVVLIKIFISYIFLKLNWIRAQIIQKDTKTM